VASPEQPYVVIPAQITKSQQAYISKRQLAIDAAKAEQQKLQDKVMLKPQKTNVVSRYMQ